MKLLVLLLICKGDSKSHPHHADDDLDPACHFDADPDPASHFDADADPDPSFPGKSAQIGSHSIHWLVICKLMRIRIQLINLMRIRIPGTYYLSI